MFSIWYMWDGLFEIWIDVCSYTCGNSAFVFPPLSKYQLHRKFYWGHFSAWAQVICFEDNFQTAFTGRESGYTCSLTIFNTSVAWKTFLHVQQSFTGKAQCTAVERGPISCTTLQKSLWNLNTLQRVDISFELVLVCTVFTTLENFETEGLLINHPIFSYVQHQ